MRRRTQENKKDKDVMPQLAQSHFIPLLLVARVFDSGILLYFFIQQKMETHLEIANEFLCLSNGGGLIVFGSRDFLCSCGTSVW